MKSTSKIEFHFFVFSKTKFCTGISRMYEMKEINPYRGRICNRIEKDNSAASKGAINTKKKLSQKPITNPVMIWYL